MLRSDFNSLVCDSIYYGSRINATPSMFPTNTATQDDDVWLKFKAKSNSQAITISDSMYGSQYFDLYFYKTCNDLTHFASALYVNSYVIQNLIADSTYLIRISSTYTNTAVATPFVICLKNSNVPPNDECTNAIDAPVNDSYLCVNSIIGTINKATSSSEGNTCGGSSDDDDVWYKFEALNTNHSVAITWLSGSYTTLNFAFYSGSSCSNFTQLSCNQATSTLSNLIIGNTYYLRVYSTGTVLNLTTSFTLCISSPPPNDDCSNSILVNVNPTLECESDTIGTLLNATQSSNLNNCSNATTNDVWYHFIATNTTHWINFSSGYGMAYSVYNYGCNNTGNALACHDGMFYNNYRTIITNLTVGDTFFIRIYKNLSASSISNNFTFCVTTPDIVPPNDECVNAIQIPTFNSYTCDSTLMCNVTSGITNSYQTTPSCATTNNIDVWYKFTAISSKMELNIFNSSDVAMSMTKAVYSGPCGSLSSPIICDYGNSNIFSNLSVGQTYFVRIFPFIGSSSPVSQFKLCMKLLEVPPNDECANAIDVPVIQGIYCDSVVAGTLFHATNSTQGFYCSNVVPIADVWYKFVAITTKHIVSLSGFDNLPDGYYAGDLKVNVYSGNCGSLGTAIYCSNFNTPSYSLLTGLIIGQTYYVRVYNASANYNKYLKFNICISIPPPPVNDECVNATLVQSEVDNSCTITSAGTLNNATPSIQTNSCSNTNDDDDVWYKFTATSPTHAVNLLNVLANTDMYHSVYSGSCQALQNLNCSDPNSSILTNLSIDSTYYVRVYSTSILAQNTTFKICTGPYLPVPTCVDNSPAGNDCANATSICDFNGYCGRTSGYYTTESWLEFDTTFCGTIENNSFLSFTPDSDSIALNVWTTSSVTNLGIQVFIFDAINCQGPVENFACWDPNYVPPGHKLLTASGLTPGHKYYMMIDGQGGDICDYVFGSTSSISNPISISPQQVDICLGDSVLLTATGGDETFSWRQSADITEISENSIYFKPSSLDSTSVFVSSFVNNISCTSEIEYQINVRACICPIIATNNSDSCVNNSFDLFATDVFGASFEWQDQNGIISTLQNPTNIVPPNIAGTHLYTVTATNGTETCSATTQITVNPIDESVFAYTDTIFCLNEVTISPIISGLLVGTYSSSNPNLIINPNSGDITVSSASAGDYDITFVSSSSCPQTSTETISFVGVPTVNPVLNQTICLDEVFTSINFTGSNVDSYSWINNNTSIGIGATGTGAISSFSPLIDNAIATIEVTPQNSTCSGTPINFTLAVNAFPTINPVLDQEICLGESFTEIVFSGTNATNYIWTNDNSALGLNSNEIGNITAFAPLIDNSTATIEVTPENAICSGNPITFTLTVLESPQITFTAQNPLCSNITSFPLMNGSPSGGIYTGNSVVNNVFNPSLAGLGSHTISYTFVDALTNCSTTDSFQIEVVDCAGLNENNFSDKIQIFPNPTDGILNILSVENFTYELTDTHGKIILNGESENSKVLNLNSYSKGVYYLKVVSERNTILEKVVLE